MTEARSCRYGHGGLELLPGAFGMVGGDVVKGNVAATDDDLKLFSPNGQWFALRVWRCPSCGTLELADDMV